MKLLVVTLLAFVCMVYAEESKYTSKYDNVNIDEILNTERLFNNYFKCLMETGKCSPEGRELKTLLPDGLKTGCSKCTDKQREETEKVIKFISEKKKPEWKQLQMKYDPDNVYLTKYKKDAEKANIKI